VRALAREARCRSAGGQGQRKVFLDNPADVWRSIFYVRDNPLKEGKRRQTWDCVSAYEG
jgi:hypothetical protein